MERPTFHESWYRVAELHPRLRSTVQISRQQFRGQPWHVVQDHSNNAFFRLAEPAFRFVGLLDGKRSVGDAWRIVNEQAGDDAPTQGEVIQLLGQLYVANLLQAEVPADTHTLFERYRKRRTREVASYFMNIMFARIPIFDPDMFLNNWLVPMFGWIFSPIGLIVWLFLIGAGVFSIAQVPGWEQKLIEPSQRLLSPGNLFWLYLAFAGIKACHELGHAISCKKFGRQSGTGGEVHIIGIMLLVFTPVPYVDASSSWALRNKWHRAIVGAAGMWVELAIASLAAMAWARYPNSNWLHNFAYNIMFVAGFSTIVFNANPLLRYDGYYILSDLLEIPNLGQRSKDYVYYLVKRWVWNVRQARSPAQTAGERIWMFFYSVTSFVMRTVVSLSIMFYLTSALEGPLIILATGMAIAGMLTWVLVPLGKFVYYLATSPELSRVRSRAILTTSITLAAVLFLLGGIPVPNRAVAQGVVESRDMSLIFADQDGQIISVAPEAVHQDGPVPVVPAGFTILRQYNPDLAAQREAKMAQYEEATVNYRASLLEKMGTAQGEAAVLESLADEIKGVDEWIDQLNVKTKISGSLITPMLEQRQFAYLHRGDRIGTVADLSHLIIRTAVSNAVSAQVDVESHPRVQIRIDGMPEVLLSGRIAQKIEVGSHDLFSPALGSQAGGDLTTTNDDRRGAKTEENFFEIRIDDIHLERGTPPMSDAYQKTGQLPLLLEQRVMVRFDLQQKPFLAQAWTRMLQMFQKKFQF